MADNIAYPWSKEIKDVYMPYIDIRPENWDKVFPYSLEVWDVSTETPTVVGSSGSTTPTISVGQSQSNNSILIKFDSQEWKIALPITPQQLTITDEFAIVNTPTLRGVLEEHNGVKYKNITMSGSTGVYPQRNSKSEYSSSYGKDYIPYIETDPLNLSFQNTGDMTNATIEQANRKKQKENEYKGGKNIYNENFVPAGGKKINIDPQQTGYFHALYFGQFLEQYAIAKKNPKNNNWRLVLKLDKDNTAYFITPISFFLNKNANKPSEIMYSFTAKAWKRVNGLESKKTIEKPFDLINVQIIQHGSSFLAAAKKLRELIALAKNNALIDAVGNVKDFLEKIRQAVILVKSLVNAAFDLADLAVQLVNDLKMAILDIISIVNLIESRATNFEKSAKNALHNFLEDLKGEFATFEEAAAANPEIKGLIYSNPILDINTTTDYSVLANTSLNNLKLNSAQKEIFDQEVSNISNRGTLELKDLASLIEKTASDISNKSGAGDPLVNAQNNKPAPKERAYPFSIEENELLLAMYDVVQAINNLTKDRSIDKINTSVVSPSKFTSDVAATIGIPIEDSKAKILVPVPYNLSIEEIAARYLKDRNRYIEIVALNGMRSPYIDETGFTLNLLSNGDGRTFTVNSNENLYEGQKINLASSTVPVFTRNISQIKKLNDITYLIETDGEATLNTLKVLDNAYMRAYLPGTVNSQDFIFIPTDLPVDQETYPTITQTIKQDSVTQLSKVDFLLTDNFDIALDNNGDFRMSSGITNLIQALKIKFMTEKGSLLAHPSFGLGIKPGLSTADISSAGIFKEIGSMILADNRFNSIKSLEVSIDGPVLSINLQVELKNNLGVVPINFTIPK